MCFDVEVTEQEQQIHWNQGKKKIDRTSEQLKSDLDGNNRFRGEQQSTEVKKGIQVGLTEANFQDMVQIGYL